MGSLSARKHVDGYKQDGAHDERKRLRFPGDALVHEAQDVSNQGEELGGEESLELAREWS